MSDKTASEVQRGLDQIRGTHGYVPRGFEILAEHAPEAFVGYMGLREFVFRKPPDGHLETWTTEFIFVLLDIQAGNITGAKAHLRGAMKAGLTVGQLTQGLMQLIMVGGITAWNLGGREVLEHGLEIAKELEAAPPRKGLVDGE